MSFLRQDYTWEDHGYSLINRLYPDVGQLLDEKFQVVYNLTYNTIAMHCGVDTSMLRRAIWNYVHCVFGIRWVPEEPPGTHPKTSPSSADMGLTKPCASRGRGSREGAGCADAGAVG